MGMRIYSCNALVRVPLRSTQGSASDRWSIVVALLLDPARESTRLARLLARWSASAKVHLILDHDGGPKTEPAPKTEAPAVDHPPKGRKPHARGLARFSARRWLAEREAQLKAGVSQSDPEPVGLGSPQGLPLRVQRGPGSQ